MICPGCSVLAGAGGVAVSLGRPTLAGASGVAVSLGRPALAGASGVAVSLGGSALAGAGGVAVSLGRSALVVGCNYSTLRLRPQPGKQKLSLRVAPDRSSVMKGDNFFL
ncbi:hypothetical protein ElyMa_003266600 [Elysia marginata]|uniref:Uncharacterized protein n=1 Tax=Elysia marginata TaxID=1093978 RepID=A0AAV4J6Z3_9GAST|nr:hypothetical protein ElyMa_003266600 [Elysia marginata]